MKTLKGAQSSPKRHGRFIHVAASYKYVTITSPDIHGRSISKRRDITIRPRTVANNTPVHHWLRTLFINTATRVTRVMIVKHDVNSSKSPCNPYGTRCVEETIPARLVHTLRGGIGRASRSFSDR